MNYWTRECEQAIPLRRELVAIMPSMISLQQLDEIADELPGPIEALLAQRHCLALDILVGEQGDLDLPEIPPEKILEGVLHHKGVHLLHRDNRARIVCANEPRPETYVFHPDQFPSVHRAGLMELVQIPFLRSAISSAAGNFLNKEDGSDADYSIFLALAVAEQLTYLDVSPNEQRRILEAYQSAVIRAAGPAVYSHSHRDTGPSRVKRALLLEKRVPHLKKLSPATDLGKPDVSIWIKDVQTRN